jgi:uncharacterized protein
MIAIDSGFIFALVDRTDPWHLRAKALTGTAEEGWVTTWPVVTETCHLLGSRLGPAYAANLLEDVISGGLQLWPIPDTQVPRALELMRQYARLPMDLADASLVLLAEHLGHGRILTTDQRDFGAYRWKSRKPFHNLMESAP